MEKENEIIKGEGKIVLQWTAPEYISHEKDKKWYMAAGIVVLAGLIWAAATGSWSMALAIVVFAAVYEYIHIYHPPKEITVKIKENGIKVGHIFYRYSDMQAFWIIYSHGLKTLNLRVSKAVLSEVVLQLNDQDPVELRKYLIGQIIEIEGRNERFGDILLRLLKL